MKRTATTKKYLKAIRVADGEKAVFTAMAYYDRPIVIFRNISN